MSEINKGFYAIIPANVRYDNEIPPNAKLFYSEITALCNEKGYCWAGNEYFTKLYDTTDRTIRRWLNILSKKGYIIVEYQYKEGTREINKRYIRLAGSASSSADEINSILGADKNVLTYGQKCPIGADKNVLQNNIINNNINNNILSGSEDKPVDKTVDKSPIEDSTTLIIREIITYLNSKCSTGYKSSSEKTKKYINARLDEGYTVDDFKKVIDTKAAEWLNTDMSKYLRPETLFGSKFEGYLNQKPVIKTSKQQQKPANKFHNFMTRDNQPESDLEARARKRLETKLKEIEAKRSVDNEQ